jgi:hypothetical protein
MISDIRSIFLDPYQFSVCDLDAIKSITTRYSSARSSTSSGIDSGTIAINGKSKRAKKGQNGSWRKKGTETYACGVVTLERKAKTCC